MVVLKLWIIFLISSIFCALHNYLNKSNFFIVNRYIISYYIVCYLFPIGWAVIREEHIKGKKRERKHQYTYSLKCLKNFTNYLGILLNMPIFFPSIFLSLSLVLPVGGSTEPKHVGKYMEWNNVDTLTIRVFSWTRPCLPTAEEEVHIYCNENHKHHKEL